MFKSMKSRVVLSVAAGLLGLVAVVDGAFQILSARPSAGLAVDAARSGAEQAIGAAKPGPKDGAAGCAKPAPDCDEVVGEAKPAPEAKAQPGSAK